MINSEFRRKAEQIFESRKGQYLKLDPDRQEDFLQELQINKIELELQNEELRQAQVELEKSRLRFRHLFHNAPLGYVVLDSVGQILQANNTFTVMVSMENKNLTGKPFASFLTKEDGAVFRARYNSIFRNPARKSLEARILSGHDKFFYADLQTALYKKSGITEKQHEELLVTVSDITRRKKDEEKINALLDEKNILLREVHHRIKNNMSTIIELLSVQTASTKSSEVASSLKNAISRIDTIKILYDKLYMTEWYLQVSVKEYLEDLLRDIIGLYPHIGNIKINKNIQDFVIPPQIVSPLGIIINELFTNSMKYAFNGKSDGEITLTVTKNRSLVTINFKDNGSGFVSDSKESKGFGLELIQMLTKQINGSFSFENDMGAKSILQFDLNTIADN